MFCFFSKESDEEFDVFNLRNVKAQSDAYRSNSEFLVQMIKFFIIFLRFVKKNQAKSDVQMWKCDLFILFK